MEKGVAVQCVCGIKIRFYGKIPETYKCFKCKHIIKVKEFEDGDKKSEKRKKIVKNWNKKI